MMEVSILVLFFFTILNLILVLIQSSRITDLKHNKELVTKDLLHTISSNFSDLCNRHYKVIESLHEHKWDITTLKGKVDGLPIELWDRKGKK